MNISLLHGDCLELMKEIPDKTVNMIMCDLPYGTTQCRWDTTIPLNKLWEQYWRICSGAIVLTAAQPFTTTLISSCIEKFRYELIWDKVNRYTGALNANRKPMRRHENICIFYEKQPTFNKQYREGKAYSVTRTQGHGEHVGDKDKDKTRIGLNDGRHNPCSIVPIKGDNKLEHGLHPTQKPIELMEYLIKTYSNPSDTILDNCMGSGTTGIACINTDRNFIGFEKDEVYFKIAEKRIHTRYASLTTEQ